MKRIPFFMALIAITILTNSCGPTLPKGVLKESYIHKYGVAMSKKDWESRGSHGKVVSTLDNGALVTRSFEGGVLQGKVTTTFPHSLTIEKTESYEDGKLISQVQHYTSGIPMLEESLENQGKRVTTWYEDGTPQSFEEYEDNRLTSGEYFTYQNEMESRVQQEEGMRIRRDAYGTLLSKDLIQNGEMILRSTFHENGDPKATTEYSAGVPNGLRKTFWIGGQPNTLEEWLEGKQHGLTTIYQNGQQWATVPYVDGKRDGTEKRFREGDLLVEEIEWSNGEKHGSYRTYIGDTVSTKWFFQGKSVSKFAFDESAR